MLTHFDDCAGIGGFALAARMAGGITTIAAREIDPYARRVYARHFPHVRLYDDCRGPVPDESPDLYTAGWPCQPVSVAGKRLGDKDPRWLWPDIARTIRVLRPRWVLLENVPGLLVRGMGQVLGDLAACGYDAEWEVLPAAAFGAPHLRHRVWIVAYPQHTYPDGFRLYRENPNETGQGGEVQSRDKQGGHSGQVREVVAGRPEQSRALADPHAAGSLNAVQAGRNATRRGGEDVADADTEGRRAWEGMVWFGPPPERDSWWSVEPNVGRVAHGIPARVDRLRGLGNAIVPHVACWIMRRIVEANRKEE